MIDWVKEGLQWVDLRSRCKNILRETEINSIPNRLYFEEVDIYYYRDYALRKGDEFLTLEDVIKLDDALCNVYTIKEAAEIWNKIPDNIRQYISHGKFRENEIKKSGGTWLITEDAMERVYGPLK